MKKLCMLVLVGVVFLTGIACPVYAQSEGDLRRLANPEQARVTQAELAQILVNVLGLYRFLPPHPTTHESISLLSENRISPVEGWEPEKVVTRGDLARVIVQALRRESEVEDPDDPLSWINLLQSLGVAINTIGEATDNLEPLAEPVAGNVFLAPALTDPVPRRDRFGEPDETVYGADAQLSLSFIPVGPDELSRIISEIEFQPPPRPPVTPN